MSGLIARGVGIDFGGGECRVMAVEGNEYRHLCTAAVPNLISRRGSPGDGYPLRRESIKRHTGMETVVDFEGHVRRTDDVLAALLKEVKAGSEAKLGASISGVAISIPPCFTDRQKKATQVCAEAAGFRNVALVDDSQAAALDHAVRTRQRGRWLIYGFGRTAFFATVLDGTQAKHHNGTVQLGGDDLSGLIVDELVRRGTPRQIGAAETDWRLAPWLFEVAGRCKRALSESEQFAVEAPVASAAGTVRVTFARTDFERLIAGRVQETLRMAEQTVQEEGIQPVDIDCVLLLGGSTKIPLVRRRIREFFPCELVDLPEDSVARGAALSASTLVGACFERNELAVPTAGMPQKLVEAWLRVQRAYEDDAMEDVIRFYNQFLEAAREDLSGMYQRRAAQLEEAGKNEEAIRLLQKGLECFRDNKAIASRLSDYYVQSATGFLRAASLARKQRDRRDCFDFCERDIKRSLSHVAGNPRAVALLEQLRIAKRMAR
jgi:actin-like ATPase involved in cell morphogenesis